MLAKINPLFATGSSGSPCENDFLTTHTQFHACPTPLNYPRAGILHKIFPVCVHEPCISVWKYFRICLLFSSTLYSFFFIFWVILFPDSRESRREICRWRGVSHFLEWRQQPPKTKILLNLLLLRKSDLKWINRQMKLLAICRQGQIYERQYGSSGTISPFKWSDHNFFVKTWKYICWILSNMVDFFFFRLQPLYLWYDLPIGKGVFIEPLLSRDCILSAAF